MAFSTHCIQIAVKAGTAVLVVIFAISFCPLGVPSDTATFFAVDTCLSLTCAYMNVGPRGRVTYGAATVNCHEADLASTSLWQILLPRMCASTLFVRQNLVTHPPHIRNVFGRRVGGAPSPWLCAMLQLAHDRRPVGHTAVTPCREKPPTNLHATRHTAMVPPSPSSHVVFAAAPANRLSPPDQHGHTPPLPNLIGHTPPSQT